MRKLIFVCTLLSLLVGVSFSTDASAQQVDLSKLKPLEETKAMTMEQYEENSVVFEKSFEGDKYLAFSIRLPKDWQQVGSDESDLEGLDDIAAEARSRANKRKLRSYEQTSSTQSSRRKDPSSRETLGILSEYAGSQELDSISKIEIEAIVLDYEMSAKHWLVNNLLTKGLNILGINQIDKTRAEAEYITLDEGFTYVTRMLAVINGSRIIIVSFTVPEQYWQKQRPIQEMALKSFAFQNPDRQGVEVTRTYSFLDLVRFDYFSSWRLTAPEAFSTAGFEALLLNTGDDKTLNGEIGINIISTEVDTTLAREVSLLQEKLKERNLNISKLVESPKGYEFQKHVKQSKIEVYTLDDGKKSFVAHEYWLAVVVEERYFYIVTMITPSRNADFFNWARNIEAFRFVTQSIRP